MIGKLTGIVEGIYGESLILDVKGVGYVVYCDTTLFSLEIINKEVSLFIETKVREDAINLFGFKSLLEKQWFNLLQTVQGIGAKLALVILSKVTIESLENIISCQDIKAIQIVPGVGAKVATRIVSELKDKLGKINTHKINVKQSTISDIKPHSKSLKEEVILAMTSLGYSEAEIIASVKYAFDHLDIASSNENIEIATIIKVALSYFSFNK